MEKISVTVKKTKRGRFQLSCVELRLPNTPKEFKGYRIAQLSDFHLGSPTPLEHITKALAITQSENPDLVVLTGDFVQMQAVDLSYTLASTLGPKRADWFAYKREVRRLAQSLAAEIAKLTASDGVIGVIGNHDHVEGAELIKRQFKERVIWLENQSCHISRGEHTLFVAGIDDYTRGKPNLSQSLNGYKVPLSAETDLSNPFFKILLSHNPDITLSEDAKLLEQIQLVLCGHTHGGQVCLPFLPPIVTRTKQSKHVRGISWHNDTLVYVTNGVGYGNIRLRLFAPPEVTIFTIL